jgi:hypothetical protein
MNTYFFILLQGPNIDKQFGPYLTLEQAIELAADHKEALVQSITVDCTLIVVEKYLDIDCSWKTLNNKITIEGY